MIRIIKDTKIIPEIFIVVLFENLVNRLYLKKLRMICKLFFRTGHIECYRQIWMLRIKIILESEKPIFIQLAAGLIAMYAANKLGRVKSAYNAKRPPENSRLKPKAGINAIICLHERDEFLFDNF